MVILILITLCLDDLLPGDLEASAHNPRLVLLPSPDKPLVTHSLTLVTTIGTILESENLVFEFGFYKLGLQLCYNVNNVTIPGFLSR